MDANDQWSSPHQTRLWHEFCPCWACVLHLHCDKVTPKVQWRLRWTGKTRYQSLQSTRSSISLHFHRVRNPKLPVFVAGQQNYLPRRELRNCVGCFHHDPLGSGHGTRSSFGSIYASIRWPQLGSMASPRRRWLAKAQGLQTRPPRYQPPDLYVVLLALTDSSQKTSCAQHSSLAQLHSSSKFQSASASHYGAWNPSHTTSPTPPKSLS